MRNARVIRAFARGLVVVLWLSMLAVAACWALDINIGVAHEPVTLVLGLVSAAVTGVLLEYARLLDFEEYSTPRALAHGYVTNFLEPAITRLAESKPGKPIVFHIYIPQQLEELEPRAIARTMTRIRENQYSSDIVHLDLEDGRARDVLTIFRDSKTDVEYFDFPGTLTTIASLVDYKMASRRDRSTDEQKAQLGRAYISEFEAEVRRLAESKGIADNTAFTDRDLAFLHTSASR